MHRVRITSGELGGRFIKTLPSLRPMMEMARKAMFDILASKIVDAHFLDLYAGSGAAGMEAVSRGAAQATFVEHDPKHAKLIQENFRSLGITDQSTLRKMAVSDYISKTADTFDVVFAAPWYKEVSELNITGWEKLLAGDGVLILEHQRSDPAPTNPMLTIINQKQYGDTALTFYQSAQ